MSLTDTLISHLASFKTAPFLFVGSGIGRRYLNLETWQDLLKRFSAELPNGFGYYLSKSNSDLSYLGTLLAEEFHDIWWKSPKFELSRTANEAQAIRHDSPLKIEISQYLKSVATATVPTYQKELAALKEVVVDGIVTTNWDLLLESIFPDFTVYCGQDKLLFSSPQGIAEIYKIHGCCTLPNSLVLTKEDYQVFGDRNPYLASKLLTIFIEHPVVFLGYSLSDPNIILILTAITRCLQSSALNLLKDRLIFVQRLENEEKETVSPSVLSLEGNVIPITLVKTADFKFTMRSRP